LTDEIEHKNQNQVYDRLTPEYNFLCSGEEDSKEEPLSVQSIDDKGGSSGDFVAANLKY